MGFINYSQIYHFFHVRLFEFIRKAAILISLCTNFSQNNPLFRNKRTRTAKQYTLFYLETNIIHLHRQEVMYICINNIVIRSKLYTLYYIEFFNIYIYKPNKLEPKLNIEIQFWVCISLNLTPIETKNIPSIQGFAN